MSFIHGLRKKLITAREAEGKKGFKGSALCRKLTGLTAAMLIASMTVGGFVSLGAELTMTTDGNVRKEASTSSDKVASASNGSTYTIEEETTGSDGNKWYKITVNGNSGYVREDLVKVSDGGGEADSSSSVLSSKAAAVSVKTDTTNVRSGPSTGESVVTQASQGTEFEVTGETMDESGTLWYQVEADGKTGFLRSDTVEVTREASADDGGGDDQADTEETAPENTTTISSVVSSRVLPEGANLEEMSIDLATLESWESGNYYVLYTKSTDDESDPGEWYLYSIEDNQFQKIATLDASSEEEAPKKKGISFKGNKKLLPIIGGVLLVVIILAIVFIIIKRRDSNRYEEMDGYDDDDDDDEDDDTYRVPAKRGARGQGGASRRDSAPRDFLTRRKDSDYYGDDEDDDDDDDEEEYTPRRGRRIMAPRDEQPQRQPAPRQRQPKSSPRRPQSRYDERDEYSDDDDLEFEFLNGK